MKYDEQKQEIQSLKAEGLNSSYRLLQCKTMFIRGLAQESEATKDRMTCESIVHSEMQKNSVNNEILTKMYTLNVLTIIVLL